MRRLHILESEDLPSTHDRETAIAATTCFLRGEEEELPMLAEYSSEFVHLDVARLTNMVDAALPAGAGAAARLEVAIHTAAALVAEDPDHGRLAARLLARQVRDGVHAGGGTTFARAVDGAARLGLVGERLHARVLEHGPALDALIVDERDDLFEYFGLRTLVDRYLLRHPTTRAPLETPQGFWMRIAAACARTLDDVAPLYQLLSRLEYLPSSPTLFNAGTRHEQLSSCFLLDSPEDTLDAIYGRYADVARLSKFAGGIGLAYHRVRSSGSLIASTNGHSNGIVPWLKTLDASVAAVNQGGKRKGACCVYLEPWHADVLDFLELRDNTGDEARRTHNLNLANWIPDLFMRRVEDDEAWSLFDPKEVPALTDLWGEAFDRAYEDAERAGLAVRIVPARELYARMMRTLAQTGNGWMTWKDACNRTCNQTATAGATVHLSNLCTEIVEVTSADETAVCNLGSINLARHTRRDGDAVTVDHDRLAATVRQAIGQLDHVIDLTWYPIATAAAANRRWRPVGLGVMGLQDVYFQMGVAFDSEAARGVSRAIAETVYLAALDASADLAAELGAHPSFADTRASAGSLQPDLWGVATDPHRAAAWAAVRAKVARHGLRNSLLIAIAPTATIASIAGCYECIEPQVSNLFRRETLSGDFVQINRYLVEALRARGLWTAAMRERITLAEGSIAGIAEIPAELRAVFRTAWELPMRAIIELAAERGAFIDQSQSLNLFMANPTIGALSSMYFHAWRRGLKTTYYLRSRPATSIAKTTVSAAPAPAAAAVACSLENPSSCEACQ